MAKKVVSFALEPDEKERIETVIARRRSGPDGRDRELKFSQWMRDAVIEKLTRDEATFHIVQPPTLVAAEEPESYKARRRRAGE